MPIQMCLHLFPFLHPPFPLHFSQQSTANCFNEFLEGLALWCIGAAMVECNTTTEQLQLNTNTDAIATEPSTAMGLHTATMQLERFTASTASSSHYGHYVLHHPSSLQQLPTMKAPQRMQNVNCAASNMCGMAICVGCLWTANMCTHRLV